jgi:hypothetical protein
MKSFVYLFTIIFLFSCEQNKQEAPQNNTQKTESISVVKKASNKTVLNIYKDPNCGCCAKWIDHLETQGFSTLTKNLEPAALDALKTEQGIEPQYQSCHTGISEEGYFFEGHIPAKVIQRFLKEKPAGALGLTVPAMPVGSPGMEVGDKFMPYKVFMKKTSGEMVVYADIDNYAAQF